MSFPKIAFAAYLIRIIVDNLYRKNNKYFTDEDLWYEFEREITSHTNNKTFEITRIVIVMEGTYRAYLGKNSKGRQMKCPTGWIPNNLFLFSWKFIGYIGKFVVEGGTIHFTPSPSNAYTHKWTFKNEYLVQSKRRESKTCCSFQDLEWLGDHCQMLTFCD